MPASDTRTLELQIRASTELLVRNLRTADAAVAQFRAKTDSELGRIDGRFAALGRPIAALKGTLAGLASGGAAGIAGAVGGASLVALAKNSLEYASSLGEVSQQLGVTTDDLQAYRYAASQVGIDQDVLDKGLAKLTQTMGRAAVGAKAPRDAFAAIGISLADLTGKTAGEVIPLIADGLSRISDPARRAAVEVALFGKAGQQLDTLLAGGSGQIDELTNAAHRLGLVLSTDQIQRADDTADKLSAVKQVLEARIAGVVADNANSILQLADALLAAANAGIKFSATIPNVNQQIRSVYGEVDRFTGALSKQGMLGRLLTGNNPFSEAPKGTSLLGDYDQGKSREIAGRLKVGGGPLLSSDAMALGRPKLSSDDVPDFLASKPKGKSAAQLEAEARREREERERDAQRYRADEARARLDLAASRADLSNDPDARLLIERERIDIAKRSRDDEIGFDLAQRRINETQAARLRSLNEQAAETDKAVLTVRREHETSEASFERQRDALGDQAALLDIYGRIAGTAAERRDIEARILAIRQREERLALEHLRDDTTRSPEDRRAATEALVRLPERQAAERDELGQRSEGPVAAFSRELRNEAADINQVLESIEVDGLRSLGDGITDVITGTRSLGEAFHNVAGQIISDLIRIAVRQAIVKPLAGALGLGFADGGRVPGFADGGLLRGPGGPRSDSILARVSAGEFIVNASATKDHLRLLHAINDNRLPRFADGGPVLPKFTTPKLGSLLGREAAAAEPRRDTLTVKLEPSPLFAASVQQTAERTVAASAPLIVDAAHAKTMTSLGRPSLPGSF